MLLFLASVALAAWVTRANYHIMRVDLVFLAFLALAPLLHRVRFSAGLERGDGHVSVRVRFGFVPAERELFTKTVVLSMALNVFLLLAWETAMQLSPSLSVHYAGLLYTSQAVRPLAARRCNAAGWKCVSPNSRDLRVLLF